MKTRAVPVRHGSEGAISRPAGPFLATFARFGPHAAIPRHFHDRPIVAVTLRGHWTSTLGRTHFDLSRADLHTEPAGDVHSNRFGIEGAEVLIVQPDPAAREQLGPCASLLADALHRTALSAHRSAQAIARELISPDAFSALAIEASALELLATFGRSARAAVDSGSWLRQVEAFMRAHFLDDVSTADLVRVAGVHASHLGRAFKRRFGCAPVTYLRILRLEWAIEQLQHSDAAISDIALAAGFADQSHFTRAFTRFAGRSPAVYRRGLRASS